MSWNYRVIRRYCDKMDEYYFTIHECHYLNKEDKIPYNWTVEDVSPMGTENLSDLEGDLQYMLEALKRPILPESVSITEYDALGSPSRGCPTEPGLKITLLLL